MEVSVMSQSSTVLPEANQTEYTQKQLADALGVRYHTVRNWRVRESGCGPLGGAKLEPDIRRIDLKTGAVIERYSKELYDRIAAILRAHEIGYYKDPDGREWVRLARASELGRKAGLVVSKSTIARNYVAEPCRVLFDENGQPRPVKHDWMRLSASPRPSLWLDQEDWLLAVRRICHGFKKGEEPDRTISTVEAAEFLGASKGTVHNAIRAGELVPDQMTRFKKRRLRLPDVMALKATCKPGKKRPRFNGLFPKEPDGRTPMTYAEAGKKLEVCSRSVGKMVATGKLAGDTREPPRSLGYPPMVPVVFDPEVSNLATSRRKLRRLRPRGKLLKTGELLQRLGIRSITDEIRARSILRALRKVVPRLAEFFVPEDAPTLTPVCHYRPGVLATYLNGRSLLDIDLESLEPQPTTAVRIPEPAGGSDNQSLPEDDGGHGAAENAGPAAATPAPSGDPQQQPTTGGARAARPSDRQDGDESSTVDRPKSPEPFVPTAYQKRILDLLEGRAMTADLLQDKLNTDRKSLYYRGLNELKEQDLVRSSRRVGGYYRPDAPPPKFAEFLGKKPTSETEAPTEETEMPTV
jgi:hypothetical protein